MNKLKYFFFIAFCVIVCDGNEPFKPFKGSIPYLVYFPSRYRGICVGSLVSRTTVLTAAVCITHPTVAAHDTRPINVVTGSSYRHARRGIRVQVTKILMPKLSNNTGARGYLIQISPALLLLMRKVPDVLAEVPLRAIPVDHAGEQILTLHEQCIMPGWHFFYKGDKIYPVQNFLLQRNVRVQYLNIAKENLWCHTLSMMFQKALTNIGFVGFYDKNSDICVKDTDRSAQPCHGMYGAPLICHGKVVGILAAPDAQWTNCTGFSNVVSHLGARHLKTFMYCVRDLFISDIAIEWETMLKNMESGLIEEYDYIPSLYDKIISASESTEEEEEIS